MKWKDQGLAVKLAIGFGALVVLVLGIGTWAVLGINGIVTDAGQVIGANHLEGVLVEHELNHLKWTKKINDLLTDSSATALTVQTDDHQCDFGKWLYGAGREQAQATVPALAPLFQQIEAPHQRLHESARAIAKVFHQADETLPATLLAGETDLLAWSGKIRDTFSKFKSSLDVSIDPTQDTLGQWLASEQAAKIYAGAGEDFKKAFDGFKSAHARLFASAAAIADNLSQAAQDPSKSLDARRVFETQTQALLQETINGLKSLRAQAEQSLAGLKEARRIYIAQTLPASDQVQQTLVAIREKARDHVLSDAQMIARAARTRLAVMVLASLATAAGIVLAVLICRAILGPMRSGVAFAHAIAGGDLKATLAVDQKDEIGDLARVLNLMAANLRTMFTDISKGVGTLSSSSTELSTISGQMSQGAEETARQSQAVTEAAEQVSATISALSAASEQTASNVHMVAAASEQMTATINEIARNTETARAISGEAMTQSRNASDQVSRLGQAAQQIDKVVETITDISEQVNLLALNATIEAARAGEAGKGFAVVANEIKELAKQTAAAAASIKEQIQGVQSSTQVTVTGIEAIADVVAKVNDIVAGIAAAIEEQSLTTREIAGNVAQAAAGIKDVNANIAHSATAANAIAAKIADVSHAAGGIAGSSATVSQSAESLSDLAVRLEQMVGRFRL